MYALVESGTITRIFHNPQGFELGDNQYSADVFTKWTKSEKEAIGLYEVTFDDTNKKNEKWYINTNQTFTYDADAGTVTAAYGTATAKAHADQGSGEDLVEGLKTILIREIKEQAGANLAKTDWYVTRKSEKSTAIPSNISTHRDAVRTKQAEMETAITNAADTAALETLYEVVNTGTEENPVYERPLGRLPELES
ncbi:MAG: hypothetical protein CBC88_02330 [Candidatus Pelagibacter sp. TMED128]|nr:MAG: hypothetical protein CBC88_02330 [Candidatus Pelagibacter sp. TMED128]|tara:strand:+ start:2232 stop:2819 length:588 start_codon:yes stop_codon:yes gene_type:complete